MLRVKRIYFLLLLLVAALCACKKDQQVPGPAPVTVEKNDTAAITSVIIEAKNNKNVLAADVSCTINDNGEITGILPDVNAVKNLALTFTTKSAGTVVKVNDAVQTSGITVTDYSKPVTLTLQTPRGNTRTYTVTIKVFTGLPILNITTNAPVVSKDDYVKGSVVINPNLSYVQDQTNLNLQIKGHGNSTWARQDFYKKPYRLKFDSKVSMLGMTAGKNWVLLANYDDKTLMRNYIALQLAKRLGSDYAPDCRFVEVFMNGEFLGNYLLTPHVDISANSINNVTEMSDKDTTDDKITGAYLLEVDQKKDADYWFVTKKNLPFCIKSPEDITPKQLDYIHNYIQATEDALFSSNFTDPNTGYAKYINPDSFMNWYFTNEIVQNEDARDFSSMFYYKDRNGKLCMGPVWDFDLSSGNIDYTVANQPTGIWFIRDATWMIRIAQDPNFVLKIRQRWSEIKDKEVKQIFADIDQTAAYLELSQQQNFKKWPILNQYVWPNYVVLGSYDKEVAYMKDFITKRVNWMDANMSSW